MAGGAGGRKTPAAGRQDNIAGMGAAAWPTLAALPDGRPVGAGPRARFHHLRRGRRSRLRAGAGPVEAHGRTSGGGPSAAKIESRWLIQVPPAGRASPSLPSSVRQTPASRSEEHTSELQSLMRISYAVFCLKKQKNRILS